MIEWKLLIFLGALSALLWFGVYSKTEKANQAPEEIEIHRYYNEGSQIECFYHQNAISCLWVMDGGK